LGNKKNRLNVSPLQTKRFRLGRSDGLEPEEVPAPPGAIRSRVARSGWVVFLNFIFTCIMLGLLLGLVLFAFGKAEFTKPGPLLGKQVVSIKKGSSLSSISTVLHQKGIISDSTIFKIGVRFYRNQSKLSAGEYRFEPNVSMQEVMDILAEGKAITHSVSFPEGFTIYQIAKRLEANEILKGDMPRVLKEGSLLPDTYIFERGATRAEMVERMRTAQNKLLADLWEKRDPDLPLTSPEELVILASIVEKETGIASERPRVASVFVNRLRKKMRLQSDPTIIYGLFGGVGKPKGRPIYKSDIEKKTPYNTYHIDGLPPTPIANPGRESLKAVANPLKTEDIFFVADGTGGHVFAKTLKEHNNNVANWRKLEKKKAAEKKKKEAEEAKPAAQ
jgi:UPF0755 protein